MAAPKHSTFLALVLSPALLAATAAILVNVYVDPYWMAPWLGERSGYAYCVDNERVNKINKMVYGGASGSTLLLGSSRSSFFDTSRMREPAFNLSVNGLRPVEFAEYVRMFVSYVGTPDTIYLGVDFFGYIKEENDEGWVATARDLERKALQPFNRLAALVDFGTLEKSKAVLLGCRAAAGRPQPYHRYDGVRSVERSPQDSAHFQDQLKFFRGLYAAKNLVDPRFREFIQQAKAQAPGSRFRVFVPPISADLFRVLIEAGRLGDYAEWLSILIDEFGDVTLFSGLNPFNEDPSNFYDTNHVYPDAAERIVDILVGNSPPLGSFGQRVDHGILRTLVGTTLRRDARYAPGDQPADTVSTPELR